jgi:O-antigen/teichoic acid export membrane protein
MNPTSKTPPPLRLTEAGVHPVIARLTRDVSLSAGARQAGVWLAASSWGTQIIQFGFSILMAHLLLPRQFGETALVTAIAGFAGIFTDLGLSAAVIHAEEVTDDLLSTAFWLSAISGVVLTLLLVAAAFPLATLYGEPRLAGLFIVVSLNFSLALGAVHIALLERTFNYRQVAFIESTASILGLVSMPIFVLIGLGVYSIVLGPLTLTVSMTLLLWWRVPWRPQLRFDLGAVRRIWAFSRGLVGFNAVNYWSRNIDNALLGATVSNAELGNYNRSYNLMLIPVGQMNTVLMRGLYPALARMRDDPRRVGRAWIRAISVSSGVLTLPLTLTMAATAPVLVRVLYGHRWIGMVPILELLCLAAVPQLVATSVGAVYRAADRNSLMFRLSLIGTAITVVAIVIGLHWGATGVSAGLLISSCVNLPVAVVPLMRILQLTWRDVILPLLAGSIPALMLIAAELGVRFSLEHRLSPFPLLVSELAAGIGVWGVVMLCSPSEVAREFRAMLRSLAGRRART